MRSIRWARWATCAIAISICAPAFADHNKSLADCTAFDQANKDDDSVEFTIHNSCTVPVDCAVSWRVVCAPESKKRRSSHAGAAKLALTDGGTQKALASAAVCGDDSFAIEQIQWSCQPNKE